MILTVKQILKLKPSFSFAIHAGDLLFSTSDVKTIMRTNYGKQGFLYENDYDNETESEVATAFCDLWNVYMNNEQDNLNKIGIALKKQYDPLSNYDKEENETIKETRGNDVLTMQKGTTNTTTLGTYESKVTVSTYDSSLKDETKETKGHLVGNSDTEALTGTNTDTQTYGDKDITRNNVTKGNIGVTTSQEMLLSELKIRQFNLVNEVVAKFIRLYCFTFWEGRF